MSHLTNNWQTVRASLSETRRAIQACVPAEPSPTAVGGADSARKEIKKKYKLPEVLEWACEFLFFYYIILLLGEMIS